ncbi:MAG: hypothetical protein H6755_00030 [Candidatus Omnitrophica bacterium]|nr:hypothetical protein [Candidatus Omnitrophota bacterium]MCP5251526.1 hypothetical protein [Burkholderiales bacterium]
MIRTFLLCFTILSITGCTTTYLVKITPKSHFDYPNSNIEQLGYVTGQASDTHFFSAPTVTSTLEYDALADALAKKAGADMLVNSYHVIDITSIPLLPITTITYKVDGTAVKMKVSDKPLSR